MRLCRIISISTILFALAIVCGSATAQEESGRPSAPKVLLFGTFHFKDAGLDVVQVTDIDIFSDQNQAYLEGLTARLAAFSPTVMLLEYNPDNEEAMNARYQEYLDGQFELPANEIYQLGFRIARKAGLDRIYSFDHREVQWPAQALFEYGEANSSKEMIALKQAIADIEETEAQARATLSLEQLLQRQNDPNHERANMDLYLLTNPVGADDNWVGANATAGWWERNFRMYARLQQHATPGARIVAIGGTGHMSILKNLLEVDRRLEGVDPRPYIASQQASEKADDQ